MSGRMPGSGRGADRRHTAVTSGPGGVMTDEVGVITGELTLATDLTGGQLRVRVQYTGAAEWYEVTGSPLPVPDGSTRAGPDELHEHLHRAVVAAAAAGLPAGLAPALAATGPREGP
ncbi:hypothetical protein HS048_35480 [Planomonospora sp. ID91781]|uniref:hypothetical protein n=1 Tax=Planomonospora sp. ID91781 TaxID=2738135 RepID=UPI0018C3F1A6|nr:hypothetical protein [Planomonospora sp. ID91781]MBG0825975.1 hypothetical protein [Planomonospora sp. ID91781]